MAAGFQLKDKLDHHELSNRLATPRPANTARSQQDEQAHPLQWSRLATIPSQAVVPRASTIVKITRPAMASIAVCSSREVRGVGGTLPCQCS